MLVRSSGSIWLILDENGNRWSTARLTHGRTGTRFVVHTVLRFCSQQPHVLAERDEAISPRLQACDQFRHRGRRGR